MNFCIKSTRLFGLKKIFGSYCYLRKSTGINAGFKMNEKAAASSKSGSVSDNSGAKADCNKYTDYVKFLELVGNLKHIKRTGWVLRDVQNCESISGHMYRMSVMTFLLEKNPESEELDRVKCMEMALVHDLAEALVGDITPYCGISREEKRNREMTAMQEIAKLIHPASDKLMELFYEYESGETPEAKFVKDLDRLDMVMQAFEYEKRDDSPKSLQEFFDNTEGKFHHPFVKNIVSEIYSQRLLHRKNATTNTSTESTKEQSTTS